MYIKNEKTYLTYQDIKICTNSIVKYIKNTQESNPNTIFHLVGIARGSFNLIQAVSNQCQLPYTILQYSTYDGNDKEVKFGFSSQPIENNVTFLILDDIADTGNTIFKTIEFLNKDMNKNMKQVKDIKVYTVVGNPKHNVNWMYYINHEQLKHKWVVFPYENTEVIEECNSCQEGEPCNKTIGYTHCNIFNKSFRNDHSCKHFG